MVGFALAVTPIMLTPGVSATLATQRVIRDGRRAGLRVAGGTACGLIVHATTATVALVSQSAAAFSILKALGAAYLIILGISTLRSATSGQDGRHGLRLPWTGHGAFTQALLGNLLNPRAASVYLTLVPQFIAPGDDVLVVTLSLVAVHIAMQTAWLSLWTILVAKAHRGLRSGRARRSLDRLSGAVLIGLGVRTAFQARSG
jgi:threonine/homoserine/homoserine lactone efflux protein